MLVHVVSLVFAYPLSIRHSMRQMMWQTPRAWSAAIPGPGEPITTNVRYCACSPVCIRVKEQRRGLLLSTFMETSGVAVLRAGRASCIAGIRCVHLRKLTQQVGTMATVDRGRSWTGKRDCAVVMSHVSPLPPRQPSSAPISLR